MYLMWSWLIALLGDPVPRLLPTADAQGTALDLNQSVSVNMGDDTRCGVAGRCALICELRNVIECALILANGGAIVPQHLPKELLARAPADANAAPAQVEAGAATAVAVLALEELGKRHIRQVLGQCRGNKTRAAERLGIRGSRCVIEPRSAPHGHRGAQGVAV